MIILKSVPMTRMTQSLKKALPSQFCFSWHYSSIIQFSSVPQMTAFRSIYYRECPLIYSCMKLRVLGLVHKQYPLTAFQNFSTGNKAETESGKGHVHAVLLRKLNVALKDHQVDEAWVAYNDFSKLYGFPNHSITREFIIELSYSSDPHWLQRACDLVFLILKEKSNLIQPEFLIKLCLSLARAQMPSPASMIFRLMLEKEMLPSENIMLELFFLHMVKTEVGTYLASNILIELCDHYEQLNAKRSSAKRMKLETLIFNLVLDACLRFGSTFKGQHIVELMSRAGVVADAHSIVIISQIHEANGLRDELKKFKPHVEQVGVPLIQHYRQFFDNLLNLHIKFSDLDAASELILDVYRCTGSLRSRTDRSDSRKPSLVPIGSHNLRKGLKLQILPQLLEKDCTLKVETEEKFFMYKNGKLVLTNKGIACVIILYKRRGRISELLKLLLSIQEVGSLKQEEKMCPDVVDACINLGWLETAHDILDDMELAGCRLDISLYATLLSAYHERNMKREAEAMLKQLRKSGLADQALTLLKVEDKTSLSARRVTSSGKLNLVESFIREMGELEEGVSSVVYELNSSIYFFWKAEMSDDALKTYRKMQGMKIQPTVQTYLIMVSGCSSLAMYRQITILWGDIKRHMENGDLVINRDLYESLILNFLRGGYFESLMEVIGCMKKRDTYIDKSILKTEFLKFHKDLYRNLKASNVRNDAQSKRIEYVRAFRKWVDIH